jgi:hypothetical protein
MACVLLRAGADATDVERALYSSVARATSMTALLSEERSPLATALERELDRGDFPSIEMVRPLVSQIEELPPGLCRRLAVVPVHRDARTGRVDVAVLDPLDPHVASELEFHLEAPVRLLRAREEVMREALRGLPGSATHVAPSGPPLPLVRKAPESQEDADEPVLSLARPKQTTGRKSEAAAPKRAAPEELLVLLDAIGRATMAEELAALLVRGMAPAPTIVLSVKSGVYSGRAASPFLPSEAVKRLKLEAGTPSIVETAARAGFYLGVLPRTAIHAPLRDAFGGGEGRELYVVPVLLSSHPTLMLVSEIAVLGASVEASRRADELARAVARALERIVIEKKRG